MGIHADTQVEGAILLCQFQAFQCTDLGLSANQLLMAELAAPLSVPHKKVSQDDELNLHISEV